MAPEGIVGIGSMDITTDEDDTNGGEYVSDLE
jgi:hypothetical protein